jgi:tetratricopeptide (TPR) repeat protein
VSAVATERLPRAASAVTDRILALTTRSPQQALALARRAMASPEARDPVLRPRYLRALGHALRAVGDFRAARRCYVACRRLFLKSSQELEHALSALGLVDACMYLGRTHEALKAAEEARRVFIRHGDRLRLARLETNVGNLYHRVDALEQALERYDRAARLFEQVGAPVDRARVQHNRANVLTYLGRRAEAEALYRSAGETLAAAGEVVQAAQIRYGIACLRFLNGEYAAAVQELEEVRPELERLGARPLLALADIDLAEVLLAMRLYPEALTLARAARGWFRPHGVRLDAARCDLVAGFALARQGESAAGARTLDGALAVFRSHRHLGGRASVALGKALLASQAGRHRTAAAHALRARRTFRLAGFPARALAAGAAAVEALLAAGAPGRARVLARAFLLEPPAPGDAYSRARLARVQAAAAAAAGELRSALRAYRDALDWSSRAQSALFVDEWRVGFLQEEPPVLDEILGMLLRRNPAMEAEEIWRWIARVRWPPEPGGGLDAAPGAAVRRRIDHLRAELETCYAQLWKLESGARHAAPANLRALERRALGLERQLRRLAGPGPRRAAGGTGGFAPPGAGELRILYFSAGGWLSALVQDRAGWRVHASLAPVAEIARLVRLFLYQMDVGGSRVPMLAGQRALVEKRAADHLQALSRIVFHPGLAQGPPPRRLRIHPHGELFRVPFQTLSWDGWPLVESCEVVVEGPPGQAPAAAPGARRGACVIGFGAGRDAIELEARSVAGLLERAGVEVELRRGGEAGWEALREAARSRALLHVVGHAVYRAEHPEFSAVRLADRWVSGRDFANLPLEGTTVVLSACETGPRGIVSGEEMLGLIRGLTRAGARTILSTLWRVDDQATLEFMMDLYSGWGRQALGPALRDVQRRRVAAGAPLFLWAPFCLLGDPEARLPAMARAGARE